MTDVPSAPRMVPSREALPARPGPKVWITGGGTREPLDDVRYLGNVSTGRLAIALTARSVERGVEPTLFWPRHLEAPSELATMALRRFETTADLRSALEREIESVGAPDALVHAAAVSDYAPARSEGKVPSGAEEWPIVLRRVPKVVDRFRELCPEAFLVLFKLESRIDADELRRRAVRAGRRVGAQRIFANLLAEVGDDHRGFLLDEEGEVLARPSGREAIAAALIDDLLAALRGATVRPSPPDLAQRSP